MDQPLLEEAEECRPGENVFTVRRTAYRAQAVKETESLDYHLIHNDVQSRKRHRTSWFTQRSVLGVKPYTLVKLCVTMAIGLTVGVLAVGLAIGTENLINFKNRTTRAIIHDGHPLGVIRACLFHVIFSIACVLVGASLVQFWAPAASGAGVSLIIAYLNGCAVPRLLNHRNLITKWVGTILGVSSNLALGPEAPMVHLGASVAHVYTHLTCMLFSQWQDLQKWFLCFTNCKRRKADKEDNAVPMTIFQNDAERREFICAGAAAGIAAAFGAPIGGVLFSMEEASTHWSRKVAWRCFLCTTVSVFTLAQLHPRWKNGVLSFKGVAELSNAEWFSQLPFLFLVCVGGGLLGALFNSLHERLFPYRANRQHNLMRLLEVAAIAAFTVISMFMLAYFVGTCVDVPEWHEKGYGFTFYCTGGEYNDLATAFLANPDDTIRHIFSLGSLSPKSQVCHGENCYFTLRSLIILCPSYLIFMTLSAGIAIPGGLFMPSMLVGGSFGATCGLMLMEFFPGWNIQPGVYAMCAATAMLGGVFRASISLVVLLVEGTQSTKFMLGIIIAVICSNWIGDWILREGVYETDLEADGSVVFLRPSPPLPLYDKLVSQFMAWPVWCFREVESVAYVKRVLTETTHNGFPVVCAAQGEGPHPLPLPVLSGHGGRAQALQGLILRSQLLVLLEEKVFCDQQGIPLEEESEENKERKEAALDSKMRLFYRINRAHTHMRETILKAHLVNGSDGEPEEPSSPRGAIVDEAGVISQAAKDPESLQASSLYIDLRPFMDRAPPTVRPETPGERAHLIFLSLGLRHLPVVDEHSRVAGIITRKDLDNAAGFGPWRRNKQVPQAYALGSLASLPSASSLARSILTSLTTVTPVAHSPSQPSPFANSGTGSPSVHSGQQESSHHSRDSSNSRRRENEGHVQNGGSGAVPPAAIRTANSEGSRRMLPSDRALMSWDST